MMNLQRCSAETNGIRFSEVCKEALLKLTPLAPLAPRLTPGRRISVYEQETSDPGFLVRSLFFPLNPRYDLARKSTAIIAIIPIELTRQP